MRLTWAAVLVTVSACGVGGKGDQPWDKNGDGLTAACEGLNSQTCSATPGCLGVSLVCTLECRDDGQGGCLPCDSFQCVPNLARCEDLNQAECSADPRCFVALVACAAVCEDDGTGGCKPSPCTGGSACLPRSTEPAPLPPPTRPDCAQIPLGFCALIPACEIQTLTMCTGVAGPISESGDGPALGCGGGCTTITACANRQPVSGCEETAVDQCGANPACVLESEPICEIACLTEPCPPCATAKSRCVTAPIVNGCDTRALDQCSSDGQCMVESFACVAVCQDDGNGGCLPCPGQPSRCVAVPVESPRPLPPTP